MTAATGKPPFPEAVETRSEVNGFMRMRSERGPFDFRSSDNPEWRQYGQASTMLYLAVINNWGAVSVKLHLRDYPDGIDPLGRTLGVGVARHNFIEPPEDHPYGPSDCDLLAEGGKCWGSVSYLEADMPAAHYDARGEDAVWEWLETEHRGTYPRSAE